jgi:TPP-dependent pyruvate/acetoin dehydrogenase alpha subunit
VLKQLPILFVCENNAYAIHTHQNRRQGLADICARARGYGLPAERIEGNDVVALYERVRDLAPLLRAGAGPHFLEVMTYRWREHVGPGMDYQLGFRSEEECKPWIASDQVTRLEGMVDPEVGERIRGEVGEEVAAAFAFAETSPVPEAEELLADTFKE